MSSKIPGQASTMDSSNIQPTARRHCGSSWIRDPMSHANDISEGFYFSEIHGYENWQARLPDASQAKENCRMYAARKPVVNKPAPLSFTIQALQNEIEHEHQEKLDSRAEKRKNTMAEKKAAAECLKKARALVAKSRPKKPKAEPKAATRGSARIAARTEAAQKTDSLKIVQTSPPMKATKMKHVASKNPSRTASILKARLFTPESSTLHRISTLSKGEDVELVDFGEDTKKVNSPEIEESSEVNDMVEVKKELTEVVSLTKVTESSEVKESPEITESTEVMESIEVITSHDITALLEYAVLTDFTESTEVTDLCEKNDAPREKSTRIAEQEEATPRVEEGVSSSGTTSWSFDRRARLCESLSSPKDDTVTQGYPRSKSEG